MSEVSIQSITYEVDGKSYTAHPATDDELKAAKLDRGCNCGAEQCIGGWRYRCMAGGGGGCVWYRTNEVC
jgi:hypothetical protein